VTVLDFKFLSFIFLTKNYNSMCLKNYVDIRVVFYSSFQELAYWFCIVSCACLVSVSLFSRIQVTATFYYIHMYEVVHILPKFVFSIKQ